MEQKLTGVNGHYPAVELGLSFRKTLQNKELVHSLCILI